MSAILEGQAAIALRTHILIFHTYTGVWIIKNKVV
jgi:hypothetical protein